MSWRKNASLIYVVLILGFFRSCLEEIKLNIDNNELDIRFNTLFSFLIGQYSISREAYTYYKDINDLIAFDCSLYNTPPVRLTSNLFSLSQPDQKLHGFFSIHSKTKKRLFISPTEIGFEIPSDCSTNPSQSFNIPKHCFDCTILQSSSRIKPDYQPF